MQFFKTLTLAAAVLATYVAADCTSHCSTLADAQNNDPVSQNDVDNAQQAVDDNNCDCSADSGSQRLALGVAAALPVFGLALHR